MTTGQPYRGVNGFLLGLTAAEEGYATRYWGTYRQIAELLGTKRLESLSPADVRAFLTRLTHKTTAATARNPIESCALLSRRPAAKS